MSQSWHLCTSCATTRDRRGEPLEMLFPLPQGATCEGCGTKEFVYLVKPDYKRIPDKYKAD